jgi:polyisoprenoid-binding protein YceI
MPRFRFSIGSLLLAVALPAAAQETSTVPLDPQRSLAEFDVRVLWMFDVHGKFGTVNGSVRLDRAAQSAKVEARIDARGVDMRRESYEEWVRSPEFFDVAAHPEIRFESEPFPLATLDLGGDIVGNLTVRGVTRQTRWNLRPSECPGRAAVDCPVLADGVIERSEFGMTSRRATLSDKVRLHFRIYAAPSGGSS